MTTSPGPIETDDPLPVADLASDFVAAVCRPGDVAEVRDALARQAPGDLAGMVAVVDDHQPMTLEVVVDVLAELAVSPAAIAAAVGVDPDDVEVLLGSPLDTPRPSLLAADTRVIDVGDSATEASVRVEVHGLDRSDDAGDDGVDGDDANDGDVAVAAGMDDASPAASADAVVRVHGRGDGATDVDPSRRGSGSSEVDRSRRRRAVGAIVLFLLLVGGAIALAWLLGAI